MPCICVTTKHGETWLNTAHIVCVRPGDMQTCQAFIERDDIDECHGTAESMRDIMAMIASAEKKHD